MTPVHVITDQDRSLLRELRHRRAEARRAHRGLPPEASGVGGRIADAVAAGVGSWRFVLVQSALLGAWLVGNALVGRSAWDPYPFILLNLLLSFQAAYTAPIIMMSQNRQAGADRRHAEGDYQVNIKAELEIELLHHKIDVLREQDLAALTKAVEELTARLAQRPETEGQKT